MTYISTRTEGDAVSFETALVHGLAPDGGLYVPSAYPKWSGNVYRRLARASYQEVAATCFQHFVGNFMTRDKINQLVEQAYGSFSHQAICPLKQIGTKAWMVELWHGESFSFKDIAMQVLAPLLDEALTRKGATANILCATSGDTGSAAMAAFARSNCVNLFVLYPKGGISSIQQKQMTSREEKHIYAMELDGTFDDCQRLVKQCFADKAFSDEVHLAAVNSINWARIMAQTVYYWTTCLALGANHQRKVNFIVPSGNFGDIYAGFVAKKMGAPIGKLVIANNENAVLAHALQTGIYRPAQSVATLSPAMDIQAPSNFERLLFDVAMRRPHEVANLFAQLAQAGEITFPQKMIHKMRKHFMAAKASDEEILTAMRTCHQKTGEVIDPHTACAWVALEKVGKKLKGNTVILSTAAPVKFADSVERALGFAPAPLTLPEGERKHSVEASVSAIAAFIRNKANV